MGQHLAEFVAAVAPPRLTSRRTSAYGALAALAVTVAALMAVGPGRAAAESVSCGVTITVDTKLSRDLRDCPGSGIAIGADDITLDLNGHTIDGDSQSSCPDNEVCDLGIDNTAGHNGVTIKDGAIQEFATGIFVVGASDTSSAVWHRRTTASAACSSSRRRAR